MASVDKSTTSGAWTIKAEGPPVVLQIRIRLTPKSDRDSVCGLIESTDGTAIKVRVRAIPENGAANKALIATLAKWLSVPKSSISLSAGSKSRTKLLAILATTSDINRITDQIDSLSET